MEDGKPDEGDTDGKETVDDSKNDKEDTSELDKLKAHNDELEKELIKGRELKAEAQKLEAEKMVGGESEAGKEPEKPKDETPQDYSKKAAEGEIEYNE